MNDKKHNRDAELDALIDEADRYMRVRGVPLRHKMRLMEELLVHYRERKTGKARIDDE